MSTLDFSAMTLSIIPLHIIIIGIMFGSRRAYGFVAFPRGGSFGYLAAVAMPLDLPNRNVFMAFNFEANYGLPPNDSYYEWINRWDLTNVNLGLEGNVTSINGRAHNHKTEPSRRSISGSCYTRDSFYNSIVGFLQHFGFNGTACLWRTICEVASEKVDMTNGLLGSFLSILFMPSTSMPEVPANQVRMKGSYNAELYGRHHGNCRWYYHFCPEGPLDMISAFYLH